MGLCQQLNEVIRHSAGARLTFSSFGTGENLDVDWDIPATESNWGVVGAKVLYSNGIVFAHGKRVVHKRGIRRHHANIGWAERDGAAYSGVRSCDSVTVHGFKISKAAWEAVGGFDEKFDVFYGSAELVPDTLWLDDFCLRVRQAGWDVVCDGRWTLVDDRLTSIGEDGRRFEHPIAQKLYRYWERKWGWHPEFPNLSVIRARWGEEDPLSHRIGGTIKDVWQEPSPDLDVCVVSCAASTKLERCLASVFASTYTGKIRVLLFGNGVDLSAYQRGGDGGSFARLREISVFHVPVNIGLPAAMNWLATKVEAPVVARLDDDVVIPPEGFSVLVEDLHANPYLGAVMPKIVFREPPHAICWANLQTWPRYAFHTLEADTGQHSCVRLVALAVGTCLLYRQKAFLAAGDFDLGMSPSQTEDLDHTIAVQDAGYDLLYDGRVTVLHDSAAENHLRHSHRTGLNGRLHEERKLVKWGSDIHEILERGLAEKG